MTARAALAVLAALLAACAPRPARLEVPAATRLVVVAPHPDDETLAAAGLVQRVLRTGGTVRWVVLTAGDGYVDAAATLTGHATPTPADLRTLGDVRAAEAREAARRLGVRDVVLLGGPDGGLDALWREPDAPWVSPLSERGPFTGTATLAALRAAVAAASPTLVVAPDPGDVHLDHAAAGDFAAAAAAALPVRPTVLTYVVHDPQWPPERPPDDVLPPPRGPRWSLRRWVSFALTPDEVAAKRAALDAYASQRPQLGGLLDRFVRRNEVFAVAAELPR